MPQIRPIRPLKEVLPLLHEAVARLAFAGQDFPARIRTLRGIYYGTRHSLDFERRRSGLRNVGFNLYLQSWPPADPSYLLGAALLRSLKDSAEVSHEGRTLDLGHVFVGLEARCKRRVRRVPLPIHGGTGLELATWLGDLGGAAGLLAIQRMDAPSTRAVDLLFSPDQYDLTANLEGDLAGYLVARDRKAGPRVTAPDGGTFSTVPEAIETYAAQGAVDSDWNGRYGIFVQMIGGHVEPSGIGNRLALTRRIQAQTKAFASCYVVYRLRHLKRFSRAALKSAGRHVAGASNELGLIFVDLLQRGITLGADSFGPVYDPDPQTVLGAPLWLRFLA
ncbi:MAG TPA: hypothetical protein VK914_07705 [bacterium]|jgi:hypothetical protein|nr:hypothetical protein [bacterium]